MGERFSSAFDGLIKENAEIVPRIPFIVICDFFIEGFRRSKKGSAKKGKTSPLLAHVLEIERESRRYQVTRLVAQAECEFEARFKRPCHLPTSATSER